MFTFNNLVQLLTNIAQNHKQIHSFGVGDYHEIGSGKLLYGAMPQQDGESRSPVYPLMWMIPMESNIEGQVTVMYFTLVIADLVDKAEVIENEVLSDTHQIAHDVVAMLMYESDTNKSFSVIDKNIVLHPFTERFDDETTGYFMDIGIRVPIGFSNCELPRF